jgi:hypothetical protein
MEHKSLNTTQVQSRHAFHIPADKLQADPTYLDRFLSFAKASNTQRTLVEVPSLQSLPISAISTLIQNGMHVDIFLKTNLIEEFDLLGYQDLINNLAGLQIERVILFDRPNRQDFWRPESWVKPDLVDQFLEKFIILAEKCLEKNIQPVFPPLQPAGDYWDTAFLRLTLQNMKDKGKSTLLESLMLSTYCWTYERPLNWGAGGPECWPSSAPYYTPEDSQDQQGFCTFEWYQAQVKAVLNTTLPILLLEAGRSAEYGSASQNAEEEEATATVQKILNRLYTAETIAEEESNPSVLLPEEVVTCNFLVDVEWETLQALFSGSPVSQPTVLEPETAATGEEPKSIASAESQHYLLLPDESWLENPMKAALLEPFRSRYHPLVGTSLSEALDAREVTLIITDQDAAEEKVDALSQNENILIRRMRLQINPAMEEGNDH